MGYPRLISFGGSTRSVREWADFLGIERKLLDCRLLHWPLEKALSTHGHVRHRLLTFRGESLTRGEWARRLGISVSALEYRLALWPLERALGAKRQKAPRKVLVRGVEKIRCPGCENLCTEGDFYKLRGGRSSVYCKRCKRARDKEYRSSSSAKSRRRAYCKERYARDPTFREQQRLGQLRWSRTASGRLKNALKNHRRRALLLSALSTLTAAEWEAILLKYRRRCAYCSGRRRLTMDHVVPLARGGTHSKDNVVPACLSCNSRKGSSDWSGRLSLL